VLAGKRVRRAAAGGAAREEPEEEEGDEDDAEGRLARSDAAKLRPSYIAWHTAPKAQRFGQFRCAAGVLAVFVQLSAC
jgi:hypothetical protein